MAGASGRWGDLSARTVSGIALSAVGMAGIVAGGVWFQMLAVFVTAVMIWELWTMIEPGRPTPGMLLSALAASVLSAEFAAPGDLALMPLLLAAPVAGALALSRERLTFLAYALAIEIAGLGLVIYRMDYGFLWLLWLVLVVIATDIAGYVAGRAIGGPKFWPRVSPKKTWSGAVAGWIAAIGVGLIFDIFARIGPAIVPFSAAVSLASQMGDIAESAVKRRMGVKDSSSLIPGHGGLWDRFDALLGASLFMLVVVALFGAPGIAF